MKNFQKYENYRDSNVEWIGEIPQSWDILPVRAIFQERKDKNIGPKTDFILSVMKDRGIVPYDEKGNVGNKKSENIENYKMVYPGDLVVNKMNAIIGSLGISQYHGALSQVYFVLYLRDKTKADKDYFGYLFQVKTFQKSLIKISRGIMELRESIEFDEFKKLPLLLPPLEEQQRIARFLTRKTSEIGQAIAKKQRLIELLQEQKAILINQAVTKGLNQNVSMRDSGVDWIGRIPFHWKLKRVKNVSSFITSGSRGWARYYTDEGSFFLQSGNLNDSMGIDLEKANRVNPPNGAEKIRTRLRNNDVLVCVTGANTGRVALASLEQEEVYINQHLCLIRPIKNIYPYFLAFCLNSVVGQTHFFLSQYGLKEGLGFEDIKGAFVLEPSLSEQKEISDFLLLKLREFDSAQEKVQAQINYLNEFKSIVIAQAVTGQIKV